jgi:L-ascorbate metabolism protein UlaG (beta-lactamase superfamily)
MKQRLHGHFAFRSEVVKANISIDPLPSEYPSRDNGKNSKREGDR